MHTYQSRYGQYLNHAHNHITRVAAMDSCFALVEYSDQVFYRSHLHTHAVGELFFSSQPTATTCVVWSWRLEGCFSIRLGSN